MGRNLSRLGMTDRPKTTRVRAQVLTKECGMKESTGRWTPTQAFRLSVYPRAQGMNGCHSSMMFR